IRMFVFAICIFLVIFFVKLIGEITVYFFPDKFKYVYSSFCFYLQTVVYIHTTFTFVVYMPIWMPFNMVAFFKNFRDTIGVAFGDFDNNIKSLPICICCILYINFSLDLPKWTAL